MHTLSRYKDEKKNNDKGGKEYVLKKKTVSSWADKISPHKNSDKATNLHLLTDRAFLKDDELVM